MTKKVLEELSINREIVIQLKYIAFRSAVSALLEQCIPASDVIYEFL